MNAIERRVRDIYAEMDKLYHRHLADLGQAALGYEIMYGPLTVRPWLFVVGKHPGGKKPEPLPGSPGVPLWPCVFEYATKSYDVAKQMQIAFDREQLIACTGLNAIFLRPGGDKGYDALPEPIRTKVYEFSIRATMEIVGLLQPPMLLLLGLTTLDLFPDQGKASRKDVLPGGKGRVLVRSGMIGGIGTLAMRHPTGGYSPPDDVEMKKIGAYVTDARGRLGP